MRSVQRVRFGSRNEQLTRFNSSSATDLMAAQEQHGKSTRRVTVRRCREADFIARILQRDYFDEPICHFPRSTIRALASSWFATKRGIYFLIAEVDGSYAGFVFGHTLGSNLWRLFAREHPQHFPAFFWAWARMRMPGGLLRINRNVSPQTVPLVEVAEERNGSSSTRSFAWSPANMRTGRIGLVYVNPDYRGYGVATLLLDDLVQQMATDGVARVEAHIDSLNTSSVRAFRKSGWQVTRMAAGDFLAEKESSE